MIHLHHASSGDAVVMRPPRLVIVVALATPPYAPPSPQSPPLLVALGDDGIRFGREARGDGTSSHGYRPGIGRARHEEAPQRQEAQGDVEDAVDDLGQQVVRYEGEAAREEGEYVEGEAEGEADQTARIEGEPLGGVEVGPEGSDAGSTHAGRPRLRG